MENIYLYHDDFPHLINLVIYLIKNKIKPFDIKPLGYKPNLFDNLINLNLTFNENIGKQLIKIIGYENFRTIHYVYLSVAVNKELIIYYYLLNYAKYKENLNKMFNLRCVSEALRLSKRVGGEAHRWKGFVRFKELQNKVLYAEINPDNNILSLVSHHFKNRLPQEYWIIKDVKRNLLSVYNQKDFYIIAGEALNLVKGTSLNENWIENLWIEFYKTVSIKERKNEKCRMNFMPKKYWHYITEVKDEL